MIDLSNTFITSDHHFFQKETDWRFHSQLFGMTKKNLDKLRIKLWNETVPKNGVVYYVGDFCDGNVKQLMYLRKRLNGKIILIKGNHDVLPIALYKAVFDDVVDELELDVNGDLIHISHFPDTSKIFKMLFKYKKIIYGHVHGSYNVFPNTWKTFCSCVENNENKPVSLKQILG